MTPRMAVLLAVVIFLTAATVVPRATADELVAKDATVVVLKHVSPTWLMSRLGLVSAEDSAAGEAAAWYRSSTTDPGGGVYLLSRDGVVHEPASDGVRIKDGQAVAPTFDPRMPNGSRTNGDISPLLPGGIDIVVPWDRDKTLILYGTSGSITDLRKVLRMLDVPQIRVQVRTTFYRLPLDQARQMGLVPKEGLQPSGFTVIAADPSGLLKSLKESKDATLIGAPVVSAINNQKATTSLTQQIPYDVTVSRVTGDGRIVEEKKTQFMNIGSSLSVLARVNGDGTITLFVEAKAPGDTVASGIEELKAHMRLADGESMVIAGPYGSRDVLLLLLIVTPTVI